MGSVRPEGELPSQASEMHRRYPRPVLRRIAFIVFAQKVGLTLEEIGHELDKLPPEMRQPSIARRIKSSVSGLTSFEPSALTFPPTTTVGSS